MPIAYMENAEISSMVNAGGEYQKSAKTGLRNPSPSEIGADFPTFVKDGDGIRQESSNTVSSDVVIARNPNPIGEVNGEPVYNEWLVPKATAIKNYGQPVVDSLGDEFGFFKKQATVKAIELTDDVMASLGAKGDTLEIAVSWSPEPMMAKVGDYLTSGGYSISKHDMADYELVSSPKLSDSIDIASRLGNFQANKRGAPAVSSETKLSM